MQRVNAKRYEKSFFRPYLKDFSHLFTMQMKLLKCSSRVSFIELPKQKKINFCQSAVVTNSIKLFFTSEWI